MAQYGRPVSPDIATNGWAPNTGTYLYEDIDESTYSDSDFIQYNGIAYCEVSLTTTLSDPYSSSGHTVRYRYGRSRTDRTLTLVVRLMQGSTEIASNTHVDPSVSFVDGSFTLTGTEADSITDYTDLRLRFDITALQNTQVYGQVSWAELEIPDAGTSPVTVNCTAPATLASSTAAATPSVGPAPLTINCTAPATLASSGQTSDIQPGAVTATSSAPVTLASSGQSATVTNVVTISCNYATLATSGQTAGVSAGTVNVQIDCQTVTLASSGQASRVLGEEFITLNSYFGVTVSNNVVIEEKLYDV